jgi:hypothetical protein
LGPREGKPVIYDWKWHYNLGGFGLWIVLVLALVFVRENRNWRVLWVFLPLGIVSMMWLGFIECMDVGSRETEMFGGLCQSGAFCITILWLLGHKVGRGNRIVTFILALVAMSIVGFVGIASYCGLELSGDMAVFVIVLALAMVTLVMGLVLAGWSCRRRFGGLRFCLWLLVWTLIACIMNILIVSAVMWVVAPPPVSVSEVLAQIGIFVLVLGLCVYSANLPYVLLGLASRFFRKRLYALAGVRPVADAHGMSEECGGQDGK